MSEADRELLRERIIAGARECIGTPWHHQARKVGVGMDCIGLVSHAMQEAGVPWPDRTNYGRLADVVAQSELILNLGLVTIPAADMEVADIVRFKVLRSLPQHISILSGKNPLRMIHIPNNGVMKCEEIELSDYWFKAIHSVLRLPQLARARA